MVIYMKILVYGAGVLGCNLAHALWTAHKDVTLLARGSWYEEIKKNGMTIRNKLFAGKKTNDRLPVINELKEQDYYDVVFVVMQCTQIDNILPVLQQNVSRNIILVGNNIYADKYAKELEGKEVLFAFFSAAGQKKGNVVESFNKNNMTIGRIDGTDQRDDFIRSIFEGTKIKVTIENKMDDWLKSHIAFTMPFVALAYYSDCNYKKIRHDENVINQCIDAIKENYDVLIDLGYEVRPQSDYEMVSSKRRQVYIFIKLCCYTILGDLCVCDHARNGVREMVYLNDQLKILKRESKIATKTSDELDQYFPTSES